MMMKELWINLPVKNVALSKAFFTKLGFTFHPRRETPEMACMPVGSKGVAVMLFSEAMFKSFTGTELADTGKGIETLLSVDAGSPEEVDEFCNNTTAAGGKVLQPGGWKDGWMYGCLVADLDGHLWNMLHMDMEKMPNP